MNYLDRLATEIRREVPPDRLPSGDTALLFRLYALLALAKGERVTAADVHDAWSAWILETNANHSSLRPYEELDSAAKVQDKPYVEAIHRIARQRLLRRPKA